MYEIFETEAILIDVIDKAERDNLFVFFTKDFGVANIYAKSTNSLSSKLRFNLNKYNFSNISFINSRNGFRLTGINNFGEDALRLNYKYLEVLARIFFVITRFVPHGESHTKLFNFVKKMNKIIFELNNNKIILEKEKVEVIESCIIFYILYNCGYTDMSQEVEIFIEKNLLFVDKVEEKDNLTYKNMIFQINRSFKQSHL